MNLQTYLGKNDLNISQFVEQANQNLKDEKLNQPTVGQVSRLELLYPENQKGAGQE